MKKIISIALIVLMVLSFAGCSAKAVELDLKKAELSLIEATYEMKTPIMQGSSQVKEENYDTFLFGINKDDLDTKTVLAYSPMIISTDSIFVGKPIDGKVESVKAALENYKKIQIDTFSWYMAGNLPIAEGAEIYEINGYVVMVMTRDNQAAKKAISDSFNADKELDKTTLVTKIANTLTSSDQTLLRVESIEKSEIAKSFNIAAEKFDAENSLAFYSEFTMDALSIVKATDSKHIKTIKEDFEAFKKATIEKYNEETDVERLAVMNNAEIYSEGDYVILLMTKDNAVAKKIITDSIIK